MTPIFLTVEEAAQLLRVNQWTIYRLLKKKQLPGARKIGRAWRFHRDTLMQWMEGEQ